ncbi:MAG: RNA 2',3'-cyclic phosphodiesterase [Candidatus Anstonellales archaeon]
MRLFVAIDLPPYMKDAIYSSLYHLLPSQARVVPKENFHITLHFIGERDESELSEINKRLSSISFYKFHIEVYGTGVFPNPARPRVLWIGANANELPILASSIVSSLGSTSEEPFVGHITLARLNHWADVSGFLSQKPSFGSFSPSSFTLKQSIFSGGGVTYTNLFNYSLL